MRHAWVNTLMHGSASERRNAVDEIAQEATPHAPLSLLLLSWALADPDVAVVKGAVVSTEALLQKLSFWPTGFGVALHQALRRLQATDCGRISKQCGEECERYIDLSSFYYNDALARDEKVLMAVCIKDGEQLQRNKERLERLHTKVNSGTLLGSNAPRLYRRGGMVGVCPLAAERWDESSFVWRSGDVLFEPYSVAFSEQRLAIGNGDEVLLFDQELRQRSALSHPWMRNVHTVEWEECGTRLLIAAAGFDCLHRFHEGKCEWEWNLWDDGQIDFAPGSGIRLTRNAASARLRGLNHNEVMVIDDPSERRWPGTGIPVFCRVGLNSASNLRRASIGFTSLHHGSAHILDRSSNHVATAAYGLWNPHGFSASATGYYYADTARGGMGMLNEDLHLQSYLSLRGLEAPTRNPLLGEWLQNAVAISNDYYALVDIHRSAIWIVDFDAREYRKISFPKAWAVQSLVEVPPRWCGVFLDES